MVLIYKMGLLQQDWKAVQRCASKIGHLQILINIKCTILNFEYRQMQHNLAIWDKTRQQILQFRTSLFQGWLKVHLNVWNQTFKYEKIELLVCIYEIPRELVFIYGISGHSGWSSPFGSLHVLQQGTIKQMFCFVSQPTGADWPTLTVGLL